MRNPWLYIALALVTLVIYLPAAYGLKDAFLSDEGSLTLDNIRYVLSLSSIRFSLKFTFVQAFISSALSVLVGSLAAFSLLILRFRGAGIYRALSIIPFMAPPMVVVAGFTSLYGPRGLLSSINPWFRVLGEGFWAVVAAHIFYNIPLSMNMVYAALVSLPRELVYSLIIYSRGRLSLVFKRILVPYILPAVSSAFILTYIYCFTSFAIPLSLGGVRYSTLEVYIYYYYKIYVDPHKAAAIAFIQYTALLGFTSLFILMHGKTFYAPVGYRHYRIPVGRRAKILFTAVLAAVTFYLYAPLLSIIYYSFYNPLTNTITLHGFERILSNSYDPGLGISTGLVYVNTAYFALMSSALSILIASIVALSGARGVDVLYVSILAISPLTISLGLARAYGWLLPNFLLIVLAHTIASLPLTTRILRIGFERIEKKFIEAAVLLGEKGLSLYTRILLPMAKPSLLVALSIALVVSLGEFSSTYFLHTPETTTLGIVAYKYRALRDFTASSASALLLLALSSIALVILSRRSERWL